MRRMTTLPAEGFAGRTRRARAEAMAIRPLRDGRYVVETTGGTYVVDVETGTCTCPDSAIRRARCKHLRRVAIEINERLIPAPGERTSACAVCGRRTFVPMFDSAPTLCERHAHAPGDLVRDRETKSLLVVVRATGKRADESATGGGRLVADYESNENYGRHEPVFEAVYVDSLPLSGGVEDLAGRTRYRFPASRLRPVESDFADAESVRHATASDRPETRQASLV
ncbi:SWIM zinc finger domain-containing protein [Halogeometricum sp. S1BR25-6]|uniref:SWIM zinc finger domain-containing protein n=1 Tax=Halogeometricum salsisoli TaxID=2950536 RepID=A0ABU2GAA5_9EURY|nr:SWIM zinc finger family protein [Halogeometricum sp. S1BR25-6]MDS0297411.1 SWIM zinc finger domain-containing protein [Halogeometricum sp. S1BR25-6]